MSQIANTKRVIFKFLTSPLYTLFELGGNELLCYKTRFVVAEPWDSFRFRQKQKRPLIKRR